MVQNFQEVSNRSRTEHLSYIYIHLCPCRKQLPLVWLWEKEPTALDNKNAFFSPVLLIMAVMTYKKISTDLIIVLNREQEEQKGRRKPTDQKKIRPKGGQSSCYKLTHWRWIWVFLPPLHIPLQYSLDNQSHEAVIPY